MDTLGDLGGSLGTLGSSLGALWGPGWFFYTDFGAFLAPFWEPKWCPKVTKNRDVFPVTFLGPFLKDFELFLERILDTFRQFQQKIEKWVKMCI